MADHRCTRILNIFNGRKPDTAVWQTIRVLHACISVSINLKYIPGAEILCVLKF